LKGSELHIGKRARILEFIEDEYAVRFMDLGIHLGSTIELMRRAPFRGASYVRTDVGTFALRHDELEHILVA
jgi:Fe2+ transport system protein FeoA